MRRKSGTIVLFGEALVDDFITEQMAGGAPFNVARHLAAFRAAPLMITRIGNDKNGAHVRREFARFGMREDGLQIDPLEETGRVVVERGADAHRFIILANQAYDYIEADAALAAMAGCSPAAFYFGTLAQRSPDARDALFRLLAASPVSRYFDLNVREGQVSERCVFESLHEADIVKVNEDELRDLFRWYTRIRPSTDSMQSDSMRAACAALIRVFSLRGLIGTLGPRGAVYYGADGDLACADRSLAPARVSDTVGAGDAFSAIYLLGSALGWPLATTLVRANEFAGAICEITGAVPSNIAFYEPWIANWLDGQS